MFPNSWSVMSVTREEIDILRKDDLEHNLTSIDASVHSHVMALAAEESRVNHGKSISIREFESKF